MNYKLYYHEARADGAYEFITEALGKKFIIYAIGEPAYALLNEEQAILTRLKFGVILHAL